VGAQPMCSTCILRTTCTGAGSLGAPAIAYVCDQFARAGLSKGVNLTNIMLRRVIEQTFKELQEKRKDQSIEAAERRRQERSKFLHGEIIHRLRNAKTHAKTGDLGIAKMLEVGFKSISEIPANNVSAHASSGAQANVTAEIDIYKPLWLRISRTTTVRGFH
jgi:hypothetical protein